MDPESQSAISLEEVVIDMQKRFTNIGSDGAEDASNHSYSSENSWNM